MEGFAGVKDAAAFEGIGILPDGTTYLDFDDSDLGPHNGGPGDFYSKFIPTHRFHGGTPITALSQSPYASGELYVLRVGLGDDYGQGREFGVTGYPETFLIDRKGRVAALRRFPVDQKWLDQQLPKLLAEQS